MKKLGLIILFLIFAGAAGTVFAQNEPVYGGTLIFGRGADSPTLDPARADDGESMKVFPSVFEKLVDFEAFSTKLKPLLAESWSVTEDGREWTFNLRKDVLFHDGTPFNADAVIFSFGRQIDPAHPYYEDDYPYRKITFNYVTNLEKINDYRVRIKLSRPYAPFLRNLAQPSAIIISPHSFIQMKGKIGDQPVGTGPFRFVKWIKGNSIVLERNEDYWGASPYLDKVVFKSIPNNQDRLLALKSHSIHAMDGIDNTAADIIRKDGNLQLKISPGMNVGYLAMNTTKKPFDQVKVRMAVNHAINKKKIIKLFYQDLAIPAKNPIPPSILGYNTKIVDYGYDPTKAKELLAEVNLDSGFDTTLWAMPVPRPYMPRPEKIARVIKANLAAVGIRARIVSYDWKTYLWKVFNGEHDMCLLGWTGDNGDPDNFLYTLLDKDNAQTPNARNVALFVHNGLHEILIKAQQEVNPGARVLLYQEAQTIIHQNAPWVPLVHTKQLIAYRKTVHNLIQQPTEDVRFHLTWLESQ